MAGLSSISSDGINWTQGSTTLQMQGSDVTWCSDINVFIACGYDGMIYTSSDGLNWLQKTSAIYGGLTKVCWSPDLHMTIISSSSTGIQYSYDSNTWVNTGISGPLYLNLACWLKKYGKFFVHSAVMLYLLSKYVTSCLL